MKKNFVTKVLYSLKWEHPFRRSVTIKYCVKMSHNKLFVSVKWEKLNFSSIFNESTLILVVILCLDRCLHRPSTTCKRFQTSWYRRWWFGYRWKYSRNNLSRVPNFSGILSKLLQFSNNRTPTFPLLPNYSSSVLRSGFPYLWYWLR